LDLIASGLQPSSEGDDETGYRVRVHSDLGGRVSDMTIYVVKEANGLRVRALGELPSELGAEALYLASNGKQRQAARWLHWARESYQASGGEDPLRKSPFARLWPEEGQGKDVQLAAAALAAEGSDPEQAARVLEAARSTAVDPNLQQIVDHALALAYAGLKQHHKRLEVGRRLYQANPGSRIAQGLVLWPLWSLEKFEESVALLEPLAKKKPDDLFYAENLIAALRRLGRNAAADQLAKDLIARGQADAGIYNNYAWYGLFRKAPRDEDLENALKAVQRRAAPDPMHTLACLYAELGRVAEARDLLVKLLESRPDGRPQSIDWYLIGRIAEQLSLPQAAREAYQKVTRPAVLGPTDTYHLAQKRLQTM
jgi:tetratricopeptide (TPR) repeat protein